VSLSSASSRRFGPRFTARKRRLVCSSSLAMNAADPAGRPALAAFRKTSGGLVVGRSLQQVGKNGEASARWTYVGQPDRAGPAPPCVDQRA
jgi:hypothetical protein